MSIQAGIVLGFDPGGENNFGWSVCQTDGNKLLIPLITGLASNSDEVIREVQAAIESLGLSGKKVLAAGIDAPMFWSMTGHRQIDSFIRDELKEKGFPPHRLGGTVQAVNSLQGACLAEGLVLAHRLYAIYHPKITETHPKALLYLLVQLKEDGDLSQLIEGARSEHERDATISAYAALVMLNRLNGFNGFSGWRDLYPDEPDPVLPFGIPASYWMPIP